MLDFEAWKAFRSLFLSPLASRTLLWQRKIWEQLVVVMLRFSIYANSLIMTLLWALKCQPEALLNNLFGMLLSRFEVESWEFRLLSWQSLIRFPPHCEALLEICRLEALRASHLNWYEKSFLVWWILSHFSFFHPCPKYWRKWGRRSDMQMCSDRAWTYRRFEAWTRIILKYFWGIFYLFS